MPKVRDAIRRIEADGWQLTRTRGSHRQFKHPNKPGLVTIAGSPNHDLPQGTWNSILKASGYLRKQPMKYAVVFEKSAKNYAAFVPDLPGCVATG